MNFYCLTNDKQFITISETANSFVDRSLHQVIPDLGYCSSLLALEWSWALSEVCEMPKFIS